MKLIRKVFLISIFSFFSFSIFAQQQAVQKASDVEEVETETSVENEYLNDIDGDIIMSLANSDELDNKLVALQYLQNAIDEGNTSEAVIKALDQLAGEGLTNQSRTNGRLINNFPEVRRQACLMMAKIPTEHSKNTLISIAVADNEPMVIAAAVKSLGEIGINENDETVEAIAFANRRNQVLNPTSSLALEVLNAYEILVASTENKKTLIDSVTRITTDYHYVTPVRQKAQKLLKELSKSAKSSNSSAAK
jgi:hypothetical protein